MEREIDEKVVDLLICTVCGEDLEIIELKKEKKDPFLKCKSCGKEFKIKEGIIIME